MSEKEHEQISRDAKESMHIQDAHSVAGSAGNSAPENETIPAGEENQHLRSHAAHLQEQGEEHTRPEGDLRRGSHPTGRRQPPQGQGRSK